MLDLDAIRKDLDAERARLVERLRDVDVEGGGGAHEIGDDEGFADSGAVTAERRELLTVAGSLRDHLEEVDAALARLDDGTYGTCTNCGNPIAEARLEALPSAQYCLTCAEKLAS